MVHLPYIIKAVTLVFKVHGVLYDILMWYVL